MAIILCNFFLYNLCRAEILKMLIPSIITLYRTTAIMGLYKILGRGNTSPLSDDIHEIESPRQKRGTIGYKSFKAFFRLTVKKAFYFVCNPGTTFRNFQTFGKIQHLHHQNTDIKTGKIVINVWNLLIAVQNLCIEVWNLRIEVRNLFIEVWNPRIEVWNLFIEVRNLLREVRNLCIEVWNLLIADWNLRTEVLNTVSNSKFQDTRSKFQALNPKS